MIVKAYTKYKQETDSVDDLLLPLNQAYHVSWKTRWEMNIIKVSASVRSEPDWMEKLEDKDAVLQWVEQLKQRPDMAQEHIDYFVAELRYYAKLQRANTASGTKLSTVDMVWTMDIDDNDTLVRNFKHYVVNALESVPTGEQDWTTIGDIEPEKTENRRMYSSTSRIVSKCKVLRLISPSLYTLFLGLSPLLKHPITIPMEALNLPSLGHIYKSNIDWNQAIQKLNQRMIGDSSFVPISEDYLDNIDYQDRHRLPTDIHVNDDGSIDFKSYINNLHPGKYPEAYDSIAKVIAKCLPTLEQVMTDWEYKRNLRVPYSYDDCLRETMVHPDENIDFERGDYHEFEVALNAWRAGIVYTTPVPNAFVEPKRPLQPKSLQNRDLQVIVKMENLYSNPTGTNIPEEEWQGDGTGSEQIVATIIYYYDVENVEGFQMEFREGITTAKLSCYGHLLAYRHLFSPSSIHGNRFYYCQEAGSIPIEQGRAVCYSNIYEHRMTEIRPRDCSKPSHVKKIVLYFVDPSIRILSTSVIPPQQQKWWIESIHTTPLMIYLPWLIQDKIFNYVKMPMPFGKAARLRKRLDDKALTEYNYDYVIDEYQNCIGRFDVVVVEHDHFIL